jgi:hypothetical protein
MGRTIDFYVVKKELAHDKSKSLCFDLEFEPDTWDLENKLAVHEYGESILDVTSGCAIEDSGSLIKKTNKLFTLKRDLYVQYVYDWHGNHAHLWCPKCKLFAQGFYKSEYVVDSYTVSHSYSNPIWYSKFNIKDLCIGKSNTEFVNLFEDHHFYREIDKYEIKMARRHIESLGEPLRYKDQDAHLETMEVLAFLDKWVDNPDVRLIIRDDY